MTNAVQDIQKLTDSALAAGIEIDSAETTEIKSRAPGSGPPSFHEQLLAKYNVTADPDGMVWFPADPDSTLAHALELAGLEPKQVTASEAAMLAEMDLHGLVAAGIIQDSAAEEARTIFADDDPVRAGGVGDGHADAFRHAYWNALMAREFGRTGRRRTALPTSGPMGRHPMPQRRPWTCTTTRWVDAFKPIIHRPHPLNFERSSRRRCVRDRLLSSAPRGNWRRATKYAWGRLESQTRSHRPRAGMSRPVPEVSRKMARTTEQPRGRRGRTAIVLHISGYLREGDFSAGVYLDVPEGSLTVHLVEP